MFELPFYHRISNRVGGAEPLFRLFIWVFPVIFCLFPLTNALARSSDSNCGMLVGLAGLLILSIMANSINIAMNILIVQSPTSQKGLSKTSAYSSMVIQCGWMWGYMGSAWLYAFSYERELFNFICMI